MRKGNDDSQLTQRNTCGKSEDVAKVCHYPLKAGIEINYGEKDENKFALESLSLVKNGNKMYGLTKLHFK